jgi:uncharacterized protein (TIGR03118 family)
MSTTSNLRRALRVAVIVLGFAAAAPALSAPPGPPGPPGPPSAPPLHPDKTNSYQVQNLVSLPAADGGTIATPPNNNHDANLRNGWGVMFNPTGPVWVSDNGTGKSTLYDGNGVPFPPVPAPPIPSPLVVTIPPAPGNDAGSPTGIAFNASNDFVVPTTPSPAVSGPARFLWASEDGAISGWAPNVDVNNAQTALVANAVYKGIAIAGDGSAHFRLYAADFIGQKIDVYDEKFKPIAMPGAFVDPGVPTDYGPFNIMNIQGNLYVAYAKTQPGSHDEAHGAGFGFVSVFDADGNLLLRLDGKKHFNAPWGMALAPQGFGKFSNDVLVGNFGDGTINAFDPHDGHFDGQLKTPDGKPLVIGGLWGIQFGNGILNQQTDTLFFAAGPNDEGDGVYGRIDLVPPVKGPKGDMGGDN